MSTKQIYRHPPVAEAVIELRFATPGAQGGLEKAAARLARPYPFTEAEKAENVNIDARSRTANFSSSWSGIKLSSLDRSEIIIFRPNAFVCAQLAPYHGWDKFQERTKNAWEELRSNQDKSLDLSRIGVRYVNRIDIPNVDNKLISINDYLHIYGVIPNQIKGTAPVQKYVMRIEYPMGEDSCNVLLTTALIPSPMVGFASVLLDIDISRMNELPRGTEEIWRLLESIRGLKNRVFEACVTDRARELFNR